MLNTMNDMSGTEGCCPFRAKINVFFSQGGALGYCYLPCGQILTAIKSESSTDA